MFLIICFSLPSFAAQYDSATAIFSMKDTQFQLEQQYEICKSAGTAKDQRDCYLECKWAYEGFIEYMNAPEENHDPLFDQCLVVALEKLWMPEKNTTDWFIVIGAAMMCYNELSSSEE